MLSPLYRWENRGPQSGSDRSQLSWKGVSSDKTVSERWRQCLILQPNDGNKGRGRANIHSPLKSEAIEIFGWGQGQLLSLEGCFWLLHLWNHMEEFHFVLHWDSFMSMFLDECHQKSLSHNCLTMDKWAVSASSESSDESVQKSYISHLWTMLASVSRIHWAQFALTYSQSPLLGGFPPLWKPGWKQLLSRHPHLSTLLPLGSTPPHTSCHSPAEDSLFELINSQPGFRPQESATGSEFLRRPWLL